MEDINLGAVQETALIPLAIRANETKGKRRIIDRKAAEIIEALGVDTKPLDKYGSHEGVVSRTILLDSAVKELIAQCPDAVCLNLGCGLDDRFSRVDNGRVRWRNIDLSDMIAFRRRFYAESDRERMEVRDILSDGWTDGIPNDREIIAVAEGLLMYFTKEQIRGLLESLRDAFPDGYLVCELMHPAMMKEDRHDTIKATKAKFGWGTESGHDLEALCGDFTLIRETSLSEEMKKYSLINKIAAVIIGKRNNRVAVFHWRASAMENKNIGRNGA